MLAEKHIVIIGGTTGIGWSAAQAFVEHGAKVVVVGKDEDTTKYASQTLGDQGIAITRDAREERTAQEAIELCKKNYGNIHGLYHVAGGSGRKKGDGPLHEMTLEGWRATLDLNITSMMLSNRAAIRAFIEQNSSGSILNVGSVLGYSPSPRYFTTHAYATSKSAVIGFSQALASYYTAYNIRINVLAPGLIETPMSQRAARDTTIMDFVKTKQPLDGGRIGQPQDLDGLACYFMSDLSAFTTGQVIAVDGGWHLSEGQYE